MAPTDETKTQGEARMVTYPNYKARWLENQHLIRAYRRNGMWAECDEAINERQALFDGRGLDYHSDVVEYWLRIARRARMALDYPAARLALVQSHRISWTVGDSPLRRLELYAQMAVDRARVAI
jgi:hypothetical protein